MFPEEPRHSGEGGRKKNTYQLSRKTHWPKTWFHCQWIPQDSFQAEQWSADHKQDFGRVPWVRSSRIPEEWLYAPKKLQDKQVYILYTYIFTLLYIYVYTHDHTTSSKAWDKEAARFFSEEDKSITHLSNTNSDQLRNIIYNSPVTMTLKQAKLQYSWVNSKIEVTLTASTGLMMHIV